MNVFYCWCFRKDWRMCLMKQYLLRWNHLSQRNAPSVFYSKWWGGRRTLVDQPRSLSVHTRSILLNSLSSYLPAVHSSGFKVHAPPPPLIYEVTLPVSLLPCSPQVTIPIQSDLFYVFFVCDQWLTYSWCAFRFAFLHQRFEKPPPSLPLHLPSTFSPSPLFTPHLPHASKDMWVDLHS